LEIEYALNPAFMHLSYHGRLSLSRLLIPKSMMLLQEQDRYRSPVPDCSHCGTKIEPTSKICSLCGKSIFLAAAPAAGGGTWLIVRPVSSTNFVTVVLGDITLSSVDASACAAVAVVVVIRQHS
jgi:hypothetical protein